MLLLRKIAFPISLLYAMVVHIRNFLFDIGIFKSRSYRTPIICIGNLSVGGTGKTPMVEFLIMLLKKEHKIAVLSRGYRRKTKGFVMADDNSTVEELGDEPFQIYSNFPEVSVTVDANRRNGLSVLEHKINPEVVLLDDAYQHRKVKPGLSILLTAYHNLYVDDWYLPTGDLRDSKREACRADLIVVTKCPPDLKETQQSAIIKKLKPKIHQKVLFSFLDYSHEIKGTNNEIKSLESFKNLKVTLVTGIADPEPLVAFLNSKGLVIEHLRFKDHHFFTKNELKVLNSKEIVLTTEKDYVRLKGKVDRLYYVSVKHAFLGTGEELLKSTITDFMG